jgi:signal transduction histidine kinase
MLTRLREFMRATEGEKVSVDIKKVIEDTIELISHRLKKINIQHILEISNNSNVLGEPNELQQVILNLLDNAIDAVEGVKNGMIFIKTYEDDKSVNIIIGDSGRGIPHDIREKIFEPFFTTKEKGKGTGLGLYISSQIIKEHGGRLYLTEEIPDGVPADIKTAFVISLPPFRVKNE